MSGFTPNRVSAGKSDGGQFAPKINGEQDIEIDVDEWDEDEEYGGHWQSDHETLMEVESDYMADVEANPSAEGLTAAAAKYRKEIKRFEVALKHRGADPAQFPSREWWNVPEGHCVTEDEVSQDDFCLAATIMEMKAVDRVNEIRNKQLEAEYGKFRSEYPEGVPEIELSTVNEYGKWSGTIQKKELGRVPGYTVNPGYEKSLAMSRSVNRVITSTDAEASYGDITEVLKDCYDSGAVAAYRLKRGGVDFYSGEPKFSEVLITPSKREVERLELDSRALSDGWL